MKILITLFLLTMTSVTFAQESCSVAIQDPYGREYEVITRYAYSRYAACSDARYACQETISEGQRYGRYYDATCVEKPNYPGPIPGPINTCTTNLVDDWGYILRSYTQTAATLWEACRRSDNLCFSEMSRTERYGLHCVRPNQPVPGPGPGPLPPRVITESCSANRYDPAGYFIETYMASHTGAIGTNVRGEACRKAINQCSMEIRGRQTCRIQ